MLITFNCNHCSAKLRINANAMGSGLNCPECEGDIHVPEMKLGPGFVVGGFLIKHKIGQGGMGEVYLATQLSLERDVALKILPSRFTRENSFVVRFLKEVHYQAKMDHPNIVTAYDAGEDNGVYFMAMAFVAGETLEEWLDREGTMSEQDALQVVRQIALALEYAAVQKGILHRDIKPANIMVSPTMHAKVLDMGLSKNTLEKKSTTLADTLLGTPNYMSPEQIDHPQDIDTRADMFSLGMTFYHMLSGLVPFEDTSYLKTLKRHAREKLEDPRKLIPGISEGCSRLLARMLARDPDDRYADWDVFLEDLQKVQTGKEMPELPAGETSLELAPSPKPKAPPTLAPAEPSTPVPAAPPKRNVPAVLLSIGIGLVLGLGSIIILTQMMPDRFAVPSKVTPTPVPPPPTPEPAPLPSPSPTPFVDEAVLKRSLTEIILGYERNPTSHDETILRLVELATASGGTAIADRAAEQIIRIRRERDEAVETARRRLREDTLRILYEQGVEAARTYLQNYEEGPFSKETELQRANLKRRIEIRAQQEKSQRDADEQKAKQLFETLCKRVAPKIVNRDWPGALEMINEAAKEPDLFPVSAGVADLRAQVADLQKVPEQVLDTYQKQLNREVLIKLKDGPITVEVVELEVDGLRVSQTLYSDEGIPQGSLEKVIPFTQLSTQELIDKLAPFVGAQYDLYRALLHYYNGDREACRPFLEAADTTLATSVYDFLFKPITLPEPKLTPEGDSDTDDLFNMRRFELPPSPASL
jgi:serine/threonine protein kinase